MFLLNIGAEIREWSTWAIALGGIAIAIFVAGWNIRGQWLKDLKEAVEKIEADLKDAREETERDLKQISNSLDHRAAADLGRWEKLELRYESLFEKLCERRRKP